MLSLYIILPNETSKFNIYKADVCSVIFPVLLIIVNLPYDGLDAKLNTVYNET